MQILKIVALGGVVLACVSASALTINRVNGSAGITYVDFSVPGTAVPLELVRAYNSITALNEKTGWSGVFGWGWTSPVETTLTVTPERYVILRDGGSGNNIIFRPKQDDPKVIASFADQVKAAYFEQKNKRKMSVGELVKLSLPEKMANDLRTSPKIRQELATRYGIKSQVATGETLVSSDYGYQTIKLKNNEWLREKDGITQVFDKDGRLSQQFDKNGVIFEYVYDTTDKLQLKEVRDKDKVTSLKFTWKGGRVVEVIDNRGLKSKYEYDGLGNLTLAIDSNSQTYTFKYENKKFPHLLTKVDYPSEAKNGNVPYRELRYDDVGLVTFHHDKDGTEVALTYGRSTSNPEDNFWTKTVKRENGATEELYEEFLLKDRGDGSKYLYKQDTKVGKELTSTIYTACCGKPAQISKNGQVTTFRYTEDGLLKEKVGPGEDTKLEYDPRWKKVTQVTQNGFLSKYEYDLRGNLIRASNSKNEKVTLTYDRNGRITDMVNAQGRQISFKYGNLGKPTLISEKGIGTIRIGYDSAGRITKTETLVPKAGGRKPTAQESQEVVRRVMRGFQDLLDIIRPAGMSIQPGA